ncbi:DUF3006 domain-containing protein [Sporosarcina sp. E16_3]|uniref:DUF3006 domain-containing protein n=1 Tax=Sporosarcina sp. E16_3 TaxID=2789293 RepID=UPI001A92855E|nr:DUF3006 domain-containing protein [Sporosarcina sp. E16_3]MBO0602511.1 DUF3006 domain-containing protein [Sporosarcina sp. E16_3]
MYPAYLDRFTDNEKALLLVEELQKEYHVDISALPTGSTAGTWLLVEIHGDELTSFQVDEGKTAEMKQEVVDRMQRLKSKKTSRFKRP